MVRTRGLEPPQPCGHRHLKPARIPNSATSAEIYYLERVFFNNALSEYLPLLVLKYRSRFYASSLFINTSEKINFTGNLLLVNELFPALCSLILR
jgi:hypothetical protein